MIEEIEKVSNVEERFEDAILNDEAEVLGEEETVLTSENRENIELDISTGNLNIDDDAALPSAVEIDLMVDSIGRPALKDDISEIVSDVLAGDETALSLENPENIEVEITPVIPNIDDDNALPSAIDDDNAIPSPVKLNLLVEDNIAPLEEELISNVDGLANEENETIALENPQNIEEITSEICNIDDDNTLPSAIESDLLVDDNAIPSEDFFVDEDVNEASSENIEIETSAEIANIDDTTAQAEQEVIGEDIAAPLGEVLISDVVYDSLAIEDGAALTLENPENIEVEISPVIPDIDDDTALPTAVELDLLVDDNETSLEIANIDDSTAQAIEQGPLLGDDEAVPFEEMLISDVVSDGLVIEGESALTLENPENIEVEISPASINVNDDNALTTAIDSDLLVDDINTALDEVHIPDVESDILAEEETVSTSESRENKDLETSPEMNNIDDDNANRESIGVAIDLESDDISALVEVSVLDAPEEQVIETTSENPGNTDNLGLPEICNDETDTLAVASEQDGLGEDTEPFEEIPNVPNVLVTEVNQSENPASTEDLVLTENDNIDVATTLNTEVLVDEVVETDPENTCGKSNSCCLEKEKREVASDESEKLSDDVMVPSSLTEHESLLVDQETEEITISINNEENESVTKEINVSVGEEEYFDSDLTIKIVVQEDDVDSSCVVEQNQEDDETVRVEWTDSTEDADTAAITTPGNPDEGIPQISEQEVENDDEEEIWHKIKLDIDKNDGEGEHETCHDLNNLDVTEKNIEHHDLEEQVSDSVPNPSEEIEAENITEEKEMIENVEEQENTINDEAENLPTLKTPNQSDNQIDYSSEQAELEEIRSESVNGEPVEEIKLIQYFVTSNDDSSDSTKIDSGDANDQIQNVDNNTFDSLNEPLSINGESVEEIQMLQSFVTNN